MTPPTREQLRAIIAKAKTEGQLFKLLSRLQALQAKFCDSVALADAIRVVKKKLVVIGGS